MLRVPELETCVTTSREIRDQLAAALELDLVGPAPSSEHEAERLEIPPSRWYLTGFLVPYEAPASQRHEDDAGGEQLDLSLEGGPGGDDDEAPERGSARRAFWPSSIGLSALVSAATEVFVYLFPDCPPRRRGSRSG